VSPDPPAYAPYVASELALALVIKASYAAPTFSGNPFHAFYADDCKALPKENDRFQDFFPYAINNLFISFRFCDASSSL